MKVQMLFGADTLSHVVPKVSVAMLVNSKLVAEGFTIAASNIGKPWGIEYKIKEDHTRKFFEDFFANKTVPADIANHPFGPKILVIEQSKRLSWHVHERKDALLAILHGVVSVYSSPTDEESGPVIESKGALIHIPQLIRHRLGSVYGWSVIAEISRNVFPDHPSDDTDERKINDDFGRQ